MGPAKLSEARPLPPRCLPCLPATMAHAPVSGVSGWGAPPPLRPVWGEPPPPAAAAADGSAAAARSGSGSGSGGGLAAPRRTPSAATSAPISEEDEDAVAAALTTSLYPEGSRGFASRRSFLVLPTAAVFAVGLALTIANWSKYDAAKLDASWSLDSCLVANASVAQNPTVPTLFRPVRCGGGG